MEKCSLSGLVAIRKGRTFTFFILFFYKSKNPKITKFQQIPNPIAENSSKHMQKTKDSASSTSTTDSPPSRKRATNVSTSWTKLHQCWRLFSSSTCTDSVSQHKDRRLDQSHWIKPAQRHVYHRQIALEEKKQMKKKHLFIWKLNVCRKIKESRDINNGEVCVCVTAAVN